MTTDKIKKTAVIIPEVEAPEVEPLDLEVSVDNETEEVVDFRVLYAVGRRKTAVARVRLHLGDKEGFEVNGMRVEEYFPGAMAKSLYSEPLRTCNVIGKYKITVKVNGSGKHAQLEAVVHGISRCLVELNTERFRPILKKRGFLTRDPRARQRRQAGCGGKARRQRQSPRR